MLHASPDPSSSVALVYPPMGPGGLASLGLGLLSAGIRRRGLTCRTFYWNLDLIEHMPGADLERRYRAYHGLTGRMWFPFNEWVFARALYGEQEPAREAAAERAVFELAARLPDAGLDAGDLLELRAATPAMIDAMVDRLAGFAVVGIATTFYQNLAALALARRLKQRRPDVLVMLGGANCDGEMGATLLEQFGFVDCVFSGEVDHAVPEFVARHARGAAVDDIAGLVRRGPDGAPLVGPPAAPLAQLDDLPYPDFDDYLAERARVGIDRLHPVTLPLESSRGCWWGAKRHCTFCGLNGNGMAYRHKQADRFRDEVETVVRRYGARYLFMADNILSMSYFGDFMDWSRSSDLGVDYFYEIKANLRKKHVEKLAEARVTAVQPGIESFSSRVLGLMNKGTTGIQNIAFLRHAREQGILPAYNILVGFPGEDPAEYTRMAAELPKLMHLWPPTSMPEIEFHRFSPYHSDPARHGLRLVPCPEYRHIYPFPDEVLARLVYVFVRADADQLDRSYLAPLSAALARWHASYRDRSALTWHTDGDDLIIDDHRPELPGGRYRLRDYAAALMRALDDPHGLADLRAHAERQVEHDAARLIALLFGSVPAPAPAIAADERLIEFSADEFLRDPEARLQPLIDAAVLYVEAAREPTRRLPLATQAPDATSGARYLALPVRADHRPLAAEWLTIGV